ncbi:MAG: 16S rRNA (uracil(1498)-N(3))-methyltransferase [Actinomycetota bacterium]
MTAPRFFVDSIEPDRLLLIGDDAVHGVRALRLRPGEIIDVSDGVGNVAACEVTDVTRNLSVSVTERRFVPQTPPRIRVYQGIPKVGKLDEVVRLLTQAGVDEIVPVAMHRSISRWDDRKAAAQLARLNLIAREAAMQSRRAWLPKVLPVVSVNDIPENALVLTEEASQRLSSALPHDVPETLSLLIGPEGGIDQQELDALEKRGCSVVSIGETVFRTQVAALVAVTLALARYGVLG